MYTVPKMVKELMFEVWGGGGGGGQFKHVKGGNGGGGAFVQTVIEVGTSCCVCSCSVVLVEISVIVMSGATLAFSSPMCGRAV